MYEILLQFMDDLLKYLQQENQTTKIGEIVAKEPISKTLLRVIGILKTIDVEVAKQTVEINKSEPSPTLFDIIIKPKTTVSENQLKNINNLLKGLRSRLNRYSSTRLQIKLNRTKHLLDNPEKTVDYDKLIKNTPSETRKEVSKEIKVLQESGNITGLLQQEIDLNKTIIKSVERVADLPKGVDDSGNRTIDYQFRTNLMTLLRLVGRESYENVEKLQNYQNALSDQSSKLKDAEKLLLTGQTTLGDSSQTLSLQQVLEVLIILTDRKELKYNCSECKNYAPSAKNNKNGFCNYSEARPTNSDKSCKDVWNLDNNDYYDASDQVIKNLENILKE
jgi:hypothetical protein